MAFITRFRIQRVIRRLLGNRSPLFRDVVSLIFLAGIVLLLFSPYLFHPDWLIWPRSGLSSDIIHLYWLHHRNLAAGIANGYVPLWDDLIVAGHPVSGEVGVLELYPFTLLYAFSSPTFAYTLLNVLHVFLAGIFAYFLIRVLFRVGRLAALIGATTFMLSPQLIAHLAGGHPANVGGQAWMPAVLLGVWVSMRPRRLWAVALGGAALAMQLMTHPQLPIGTCYLLVGMFGWQWWRVAARSGWRSRLLFDTVKRSVLVGSIVGGIGLALSAAWWMTVVELLPLLNKIEFEINVPFWYQMPPAMLLSLFAPTEFQFPEWTIYAGTVPLFLALVALGGKRRRVAIFLWLAVILALVFALGDATPIYFLARWLVPGLGYFRTRTRLWALGGLVVAFLAGMGADALGTQATWGSVNRNRRWINLAGAIYLLCGVIAGVGLGIIRQRVSVEIFGAVGAGALSLAVFWLWRRRSLHHSVCQFVLLAILLLDLFPLVAGFMTGIDPGETFLRSNSVAEFIGSQPGDFRIYAAHFEPAYALSAELDIERIDGILTLQLDHIAEIVKIASGCRLAGYAVGVPPCLSGEIDSQAYKTAKPNPGVLGLLNVRYVTADFPLDVPGLDPVMTDGETTVYENQHFLPRAFLVERVEMVSPGSSVLELLPAADLARTAFVESDAVPATLPDGPVDGEVLIESRRSGRVALTVRSSREALLLYSEAWAPGWRVTIDEEPAAVVCVDGALLGVVVPPGTWHVVFDYLPLGWKIGWPISLAATVGLLVWLVGVAYVRNLWNRGD
jgi:hypothetical protein